MKKLLLASTSTVYGGTYLSYLRDELSIFFQETNEILFVPYARPSGISHDEYTQIAANFFQQLDKKVVGLHTFVNPKQAIEQAEAIFTGGGNTFVLVNALYQLDIINSLREVVLGGTPYMGTSAGSNIAGQTMQTTNDMPIVYPPSFECMGLVPFNINPHYLDPNSALKHNGETRETRIKEFLTQNDIKVIGLREGNWIRRIGDEIRVEGTQLTRIFEKEKEPYEVEGGHLL